MRYLEPIVLLLGLSAALYKTKEIWKQDDFKSKYDDKNWGNIPRDPGERGVLAGAETVSATEISQGWDLSRFADLPGPGTYECETGDVNPAWGLPADWRASRLKMIKGEVTDLTRR